jgi:hypothetical protein
MLRGVVGIVKWSYYRAAVIEGYRVVRREQPHHDKWALTATVVMADAFKLTQRPLLFEAPYQGGVWRWPIEAFDLVNGKLTAQLGRLEGEGTWTRVLSGQTSAR